MKKLSKIVGLILGLGLLFIGCEQNVSSGGSDNGNRQDPATAEDEPVSNITVEAPLPTAPSYLITFDDEDYDGLWVNWDYVADATSYEFYYSINSFEFNPEKKLGETDVEDDFFIPLTFDKWAGNMLCLFVFAKNENGLSESYASGWYFFPTQDELATLKGGNSSGSSGSGSGSSSSGSYVTVPSAPSMQSLGFTTNKRGLTIKWRAVTGASGYNVYRANSKYSSYTKIASNINSTAYDDLRINIEPGNSYFYCVTAVNSAGESEKSNPYGTTFSKPTIQVGHGKRDSDKNSVGRCEADVGRMEYYVEKTTFTRDADYAPAQDMDEYGELEYSTRYHYMKKDGTKVWSKWTDRGSYTFLPSHKYKIDCTTGNIKETENLVINK